jgi:hypothetical protein
MIRAGKAELVDTRLAGDRENKRLEGLKHLRLTTHKPLEAAHYETHLKVLYGGNAIIISALIIAALAIAWWCQRKRPRQILRILPSNTVTTPL